MLFYGLSQRYQIDQATQVTKKVEIKRKHTLTQAESPPRPEVSCLIRTFHSLYELVYELQ